MIKIYQVAIQSDVNPAEVAALLTPEVKGRIAEAVHFAVCEDTSSDGRRLCSRYATAGAMLMEHITGQNYIPQVGAVWIGLTDDAGADDDHFSAVPERSHYDGTEFHAWFVRVPAGTPGGMQRIPDLEIIDLSLRHFPSMAKAEGFDWQRTDWPRYFWGTLGELRALRAYLRPDMKAMETIGSVRRCFKQRTASRRARFPY